MMSHTIAYFRRVTIKRACSIWNRVKTFALLSEIRNLPCVTSRLILKLDSEYRHTIGASTQTLLQRPNPYFCNGIFKIEVLMQTLLQRPNPYFYSDILKIGAPTQTLLQRPNPYFYSMSNFEIRHDVTCDRVHISGELPLNARVVYEITSNHLCYTVNCLKYAIYHV